jgi:hypothetical protein
MGTPSFPVLFLDIARGNVRALEQAVATVKSTLAVNPAAPPTPERGDSSTLPSENAGAGEFPNE